MDLLPIFVLLLASASITAWGGSAVPEDAWLGGAQPAGIMADAPSPEIDSVPPGAPVPADSAVRGAAGSSAPASRQLLVAVMQFQSAGPDSAAARIASEALATELLNTRQVGVLERDQMNLILREQGFQQSGACDQRECAVQVGRLLGADQVVVGSLGRIGQTVFLNVRMVRMETGELVRGRQFSGKGELDDVLPGLVDQASSELLATLTGKPLVSRPPVPPAAGLAIPVAASRPHGIVLGVEVTDLDGDGTFHRTHWRLSRDVKRFCCIDIAWLPGQGGGGRFSYGTSLNLGGWVMDRFDPDAVGVEVLLAGSGLINFSGTLGRGGFLRADAGLTQLTISRRETGTDWGVGLASAAGWWIPAGRRSLLVSLGTGWRTYLHLDYDQMWLANLSAGVLL